MQPQLPDPEILTHLLHTSASCSTCLRGRCEVIQMFVVVSFCQAALCPLRCEQDSELAAEYMMINDPWALLSWIGDPCVQAGGAVSCLQKLCFVTCKHEK